MLAENIELQIAANEAKCVYTVIKETYPRKMYFPTELIAMELSWTAFALLEEKKNIFSIFSLAHALNSPM